MIWKNREFWIPSKGPYFIDIDLNTKSVEGKKIEKAVRGYNKKRSGRLCLQWSRGLFCGIPFWSKLYSGNTNSIQSLSNEIGSLQQELSIYASHTLKNVIYRLDGGYWSPKLLKKLKYAWMIRGPMLKQFELEKYKKQKNIWQFYSQTTEYIDLGKQFVAEDIYAKVILIKQVERQMKQVHRNTKPKYIYYPIITNITHWKAKSLIRHYRGKQIIENHFKETNQAFFSNKLPCSKLKSNKAFLWFITFAYTISNFFKRSTFTNILSANKF